jgi:hypothetical protein
MPQTSFNYCPCLEPFSTYIFASAYPASLCFCRHYASEDVKLLESIVADSRKLEVANHEAVRTIATQLDRAKRIIIVQQAIASAISRSNLSDLGLSIATAQQLVGDDRPWLVDAVNNR